MQPGLLYRFLKLYLPFVFRIYYRRFVIQGLEHVPAGGPLIFAVNHQNAFMDAIVVAASSRRNPWFLTRASVFASPVARYWLNKLQMIPIYRFRDGMAAMKRNDETLETCSRLLQQNQCILIFPEGNHDGRWSLRPLQKGLARIVFDTIEKSGGTCKPLIVPVGLQYENIFASWSDLLISFGAPIDAYEYYGLYQSDPGKAYSGLMEEVRKGIAHLMVDIQPMGEYEARREDMLNRQGRETSLPERLAGDQRFLEKWQKGSLGEKKARKQSLRPLFCPLSALMLLPHLPAIWMIRMIVNAIVKDPHWTSSIRVAALAFGAPLVYAALLVVMSQYFEGWLWLPVGIALLFVSGWLGLEFRHRCRGSAL
ncbi:MAG: 1-acyl-sn-glycerol-3-phosphate acyltransferase [Bacteroidetes bacterium]|nr:1-acyl-sn-glycerol-3-phosphate acyltransferase [Bacteroidota bacterium]